MRTSTGNCVSCRTRWPMGAELRKTQARTPHPGLNHFPGRKRKPTTAFPPAPRARPLPHLLTPCPRSSAAPLGPPGSLLASHSPVSFLPQDPWVQFFLPALYCPLASQGRILQTFGKFISEMALVMEAAACLFGQGTGAFCVAINGQVHGGSRPVWERRGGGPSLFRLALGCSIGQPRGRSGPLPTPGPSCAAAQGMGWAHVSVHPPDGHPCPQAPSWPSCWPSWRICCRTPST